MLVCKDTMIYIHIPKTGGTSLRYFLRKQTDWGGVEMPKAYKAWWHRPYSMCPKRHKGRPIAFVRNPWDYYVSLWAYDLDNFKKNGVSVFKEFYEGSHKFDAFLNAMLLGGSNSRFKLPQNIALPIVQILGEYDIGILTFFYIYMTIENPTNFILGRLDIESFVESAKTYKIEDLNRDFEKIFGVSEAEANKFRGSEKQNISSRNRDYRVYYSEAQRKLIEHKERFIIKRFNYKY